MTPVSFGDAYQRNFEPMVRSVMRRGFRREVAEEAVQSGWATGWERLDQLRDAELLVWWIRQIVANKLRDDFRSRQRTRQLEPKETIAVPPSVNFAAMEAENILKLCDDTRHRHMCSRVYLDEWQSEQVAREMGISRQAVNSALFRTRRLLRKKLAA
jgi:RNA polymerase sigma factor (sigma-70 family)